MYNTVAVPIKWKSILYIRVASKPQVTSNSSKSKYNKGLRTVRIGNTPYVLPEQLLTPKYSYENRFHGYSILKEKMLNRIK